VNGLFTSKLIKVAFWKSSCFLIFTALLLFASAAAVCAEEEPLSPGERKLRAVLAEARERPVRIFYGGTSIQAASGAGGRRWIENLRHAFGVSGNYMIDLRFWGGSLAPVNGWRKQSGGLMVRLRGDSESEDLVFNNTFGRQMVIHYAVEADGGSFDVYVDDQKAGTIDCGGTQAYNQKFILDFPEAKYRRLTLKPPASGHVYVEAVSMRVNNPGIEVIDGSMGATAVEHLLTLSGAQERWQIPDSIQPANLYDAFDAYMLDTSAEGKCDIVYFGWAVNDAYSVQNVNARYAPAVAHLVERTKANGQSLILVVEPGGHLSVPGEPVRQQYAAYARIREVLRSYANEPHVVLNDHYELLGTPKPDATLAEWQEWAAPYYSVKISAVTPKLETQGDFIHPGKRAFDIQVAALNAAAGISDYVPSEFTWAARHPSFDAQAAQGAQQAWTDGSNWSDRRAPREHPGATVTIAQWPTDGIGPYGGRNAITLAYSTVTIGRLRLGGSSGVIVAGSHPAAGTGRLVFDNLGQPPEIKGVGDGSVTIRAAVHSEAPLRLDVGTMKSIVVQNYLGPGELRVVGSHDGDSKDAGVGFRPDSDCRKITIDPGAKVTVSGSGVPAGLKEIVVNGALELTAAGNDGVAMHDGQTLSGMGAVRVAGANPAQAVFVTAAGARLVPGADGTRPLTFSGVRLRLAGGTMELAVGEKANAGIASAHPTQPSLDVGGGAGSPKTTVRIVDAGRTSHGTVPLFSYTGPLSGDVASLELELPPRWQGKLVDNPANSTIDLHITAIQQH